MSEDLSGVFSRQSTAKEPDTIKRKHDKGVCLVLGSGGLKSLAVLPLIDHLNENNVHVSRIVGCSGGALVGGALACGYTSADIQRFMREDLKPSLFKRFDWATAKAFLGFPVQGKGRARAILRSDPMLEALGRVFGDRRIEDLQTPFHVQTTDIETGESVMLERGSLRDAIYASCALFPVFPPLEIGGRSLVDGVFSASLPVIEAAKRTSAPILAASFEPGAYHREDRNMLQQLYSLVSRASLEKDRLQNLVLLHSFDNDVYFMRYVFEKRIRIWNIQMVREIMAQGEVVLDRHRERLSHFFELIRSLDTTARDQARDVA